MFKLTKVKATDWLGNGFGYDSACWVVKDYPHITVMQLGSGGWWRAHDTKAKRTYVRYGTSRKDCTEQLWALRELFINNVYN